MLGGVEIIDAGAETSPRGIPASVVTNIPINTAPNRFRRNNEPIMRKVNAASNTLGSLKEPNVVRVGSKATTIPAFLNQ